MSLILDALKRAEQERKLGQAPEAVQATTMSPMAGPSHSRDRTLVLVLAILLLAAAILIAALLLRSHSTATAGSTAVVATAASQATRPLPAPAPPRATVSPAPAVIADHGNVNNLDDVVAADDGQAENAQAAQVAEGNMPAANTNPNPHPSAPKASKPPANPKVTVTSNTPGTTVEENDTSDQPSDAAATPPAYPGATSLRDMPAGYREAFPPLTIDVHVYNDDPEHRFIIVGGNAYHEGSSLPQGPRIVAITSDGVVFDWQGQKVLYGLGSN